MQEHLGDRREHEKERRHAPVARAPGDAVAQVPDRQCSIAEHPFRAIADSFELFSSFVFSHFLAALYLIDMPYCSREYSDTFNKRLEFTPDFGAKISRRLSLYSELKCLA